MSDAQFQPRRNRRRFIVFCLAPALLAVNAMGENEADWTPPDATDWVSLGSHLAASSKKEIGKIGETTAAPCVAVDRANGNLYAFPQGDRLWVSTDQGQTFHWLYKLVAGWGFNETPTSLVISPDGGKLAVFSSDHSGYSADAGATWRLFNFTLKFGFEVGVVNWDEDAKLVLARSHTWPSRLWISKDSGDSFTEITSPQNNDVNLGLLDGGVIASQPGNSDPYTGKHELVRSEDFGKTWENVKLPAWPGARTTKNYVQFLGVARRFKGKTYWLANCGVFTTTDSGKTWTLLGNFFPDDFVQNWNWVLTGPQFGKDENQMLVMLNDRFIETLDGGKSWHTLAYTPVKNNGGNVYQYSFAYDPIHDILYANHREHSGGPWVFGRVALKRWGKIDPTPPAKPADLAAVLTPQGNGVRLSWSASTGTSDIAFYRVYQNNILKCYTHETSAVIPDLKYNTHYNFAVRAIDDWQNLSDAATLGIDVPSSPAIGVFLSDLDWASATSEKPEPTKEHPATNEKGTPTKDTNTAGRPLILADSVFQPTIAHVPLLSPFAKGLCVCKSGTITYSLKKQYKRFVCNIGYDYQTGEQGSGAAVFSVSADGVQKYQSPVIDNNFTSIPLDIDITDVDMLTLTVTNSRNGFLNRMDWANAMVFRK